MVVSGRRKRGKGSGGMQPGKPTLMTSPGCSGSRRRGANSKSWCVILGQLILKFSPRMKLLISVVPRPWARLVSPGLVVVLCECILPHSQA